jgi:DNA primase
VRDDYLRKRRDITDDSVDHFSLGLAGEEWDGLLRYAAKRDLSGKDLENAGLAVYSDKNKSHFDRFRQRLMIPIFNLSGKPIAFGGRTLKKGEPAKYVNSPETPLYSKSNVLYGLNFSRNEIRDANDVIVVEGYFDLISLWQVGVRNVVASSGTAFTSQQARLLARFAETVYLFFDADSAGQQAAIRSVDALYDAGLEVKVIVAETGEDPDSVAREKGREAVEQLKSEALEYVAYRLRNLDRKATGLIAKEKLVKELAALASKISDPVRRTLFVEHSALALNVTVDLLTAQVRASGSPVTDTTPSPASSGTDKIERAFLSLLLQAKGSLSKTFERIAPDDFDSKTLSRLYQALKTQYDIEGELDEQQLVETFEPEMRSLVGELALQPWADRNIREELSHHTEQMAVQQKKKIRTRLQEQLAEAEASGNQEEADRIIEELKSYGL